MVVYIPNVIYDKCKKENETINDFLRTVFSEWKGEFVTTYGGYGEIDIVEKAIRQIVVIEEKFGT